MTDYLFQPDAVIAVPVQGELAAYPLRRIFCVGRNYEAHAVEMGSKGDKEEPFYFTKTPCTYLPSGSSLAYPPGTQNFHYEMELVVAMGEQAFEVSQEEALNKVYGYCCGLDMTRRDLQLRAREKSRPWDVAKDFEGACVLSPIVPASVCGHLSKGTIQLSVNGAIRQSADLSELINNVAEIVEDLSRLYHLGPGDLIMTGTPAGVGPVERSDRIVGSIQDLGEVHVTIM